MCVVEINGVALYQSNILKRFNIIHGFTTRKGGVSTGEYKSMSLSPFRGDDISCVKKNEQILCEALGLDIKKLTSTKQEHTDKVRLVKKEDAGRGVHFPWDEGVDGVITLEKNLPLICYSADCVPILMCASDIEAIAAVHSGWRGTKEKIAQKTVEKLKELGAATKNIYVAIGPCIGKCCYEVSGEVALMFDEKGYTKKDNGKYMLDLAFLNSEMLKEKDIPSENISTSGICTKCRNDLFFSHRGQNGISGTLGGIICMCD